MTLSTLESGARGALARDGFVLVPGVLDSDARLRLIRESDVLTFGAGTRNLRLTEWGRELAYGTDVINLVHLALGMGAVPVRAILFDKRPGSNWSLGYHQDTKIAVSASGPIEESKCHGFSAWSVKEGFAHAKAPARILERMVALRLHLDDCGSENGALRALPGTHLSGLLTLEEIQRAAATVEPVVCSCRAGDALLMKPLTLHASSKSESPSHRRVVHIEYSDAELPAGLSWAFA